MRFAALQFRPEKGRPDVSRVNLRRMIREASGFGANVIVCPEMATSGYVWPNAETLAPHAELSTGPTYQMLAEEARKAGAWIVCGIPERVDEAFYNSALVVNPSGELDAVYRKILLFDADENWARSGTERVLVRSVPGGLAPVICMDLNDDNLLAWLAEQNPAVVAFCTNWLEEQLPVHQYWSWRLQRFTGWFIAANSWGQDGGVEFCGQSAVFGPRGVLVAAAPRTGDGILVVDEDDYPMLIERAQDDA
jgi:predicted amidohydrolase